MTPNDNNSERFETVGRRRIGRLQRRDVLKAIGVGVGSMPIVVGTAAGETDSVATGPTQRTYPAATLDPGTLPEANPPDDPDIVGGGSSESEEVPIQRPDGAVETGGPSGSPLTRGDGASIAVRNDYDGFGTRDTVRGVDLDDSGTVEDDEKFFVVPSDAQIGTGRDYHVSVINSEVGIFEKETGDRLHHFRLEDWFENVLSLAPGEEPHQFENTQVFDPRVRYDRGADRYVVACVEFNLPDTDAGEPIDDPNDLTGAFLLSVSDTADPTGTWTNYRVPPLSNYGLVDFPQLGYGPDAVYLTQNFFAIEDGEYVFDGATMVTLDKDDLYAGEAVDALHFTDLRNPDGSLAFTVQPARQPDLGDGGGDAFHLMNARYSHGDSLTVWTVENPTDPATASVTNDELAVQPYNNPTAAKQPDTEERIDTSDTRFVEAIAYDDATGNLWAAHTINDASVRWYEVDPDGPTLVQGHTFKREGVPTSYPTIETNGESTMFVYNVSGPKDADDTKNFARVEVAGRTKEYTADQLENYAIVKEGESVYDYVNEGEGDPGSQVVRWGDYNGISIDPVDDSYWVISQYASEEQTLQTYQTRIANVDFES